MPKYIDYTLQELRYKYLTTKNPLEKDIIAIVGKYKKKTIQYTRQTKQELRKAYLSSNDENEKALIKWIGKNKK